MGINIEIPRIVAIIDINFFNTITDSISYMERRQKLIKFIKKEISYSEENILLSIGRNLIILFDEVSTTDLEKFFFKVNQKIKIIYNCFLKVGISNLCKDYKNIFKSYKEAEKALKFTETSSKNIILIETIDLVNSLIMELPQQKQKIFFDKIFENCTKKEVDEFIKLLEIFFKNNSSLAQTSEELFVHKNTLQYRLKKIFKKTSLDPRITSEAFTLYLAVLLKRNFE